MKTAENEIQQLHIYRALTAIFVEKVALVGLIEFGVLDAILRGMKKFTKISIQTSGLQLLATAVSVQEGLVAAKKCNLKDEVVAACKQHENDQIVSHLIKQVINKL